MNREIKFRAWNIKERCFSLAPIVVNMLGDIFDYNGELTDKYIIQQFTGLHDKNGKEIYEGDIVKCFMGEGVIVYEEPKYIIDCDAITDNFHMASDLEVIGNIYENPELVKSE